MRELERSRKRMAGNALPAVAAALFAAAAPAQAQPQGEWRWYGGTPGGQKYSPLDQINAENVHQLRVAWTQSAAPAAVRGGEEPRVGGNWQHTPLMVDGMLFISTELGPVAALSPTTGEVIWFDELAEPVGGQRRGITYWTDGVDGRLLVIYGQDLVALNPRTGERVGEFGEGGSVDLSIYPTARANSPVGGFSWNSPPQVVGDVIVIGGVPRMDVSRIPPGVEPALAAPGDIRGYDVRTGELLWTFHVVPRPGEYGYDTWLKNSADINGAAGTWTWMTSDEELGYVYVATEAGSNDMYGGLRPGDNLFSNSVLCLNARTGERVWHFQTVRHDLWDFDNPTGPILVDITVDGRPVKALVQLTKQAFAYVLNRETGEPVWPMEERIVPRGDTPGEWYSPTQPFPTKPPPFELQGFDADYLIDFTPELLQQAIEFVSQYRVGPLYLPPSPNQAILMFPGTVGGGDWHGAGFDPETGILYISAIRNPVFTDLEEISNPSSRYPFSRRGLGSLLNTNAELDMGGGPDARLDPSIEPHNLPITKPPYGSIVAMDLNVGDILWRVPNGDGPRNHPALRHLNLPPLGSPNRASPLVTKSLLFVGDGQRGPSGPPRIPVWGGGKMFRAFDKATGEVIWEMALSGGTSGAPITYMAGGKQYIVVAVGWEDMPAELVALTLP